MAIVRVVFYLGHRKPRTPDLSVLPFELDKHVVAVEVPKLSGKWVIDYDKVQEIALTSPKFGKAIFSKVQLLSNGGLLIGREQINLRHNKSPAERTAHIG
ncbi:hypothetical protein [Mesorhizobium sp. CN2-181]|uniref:hypothetical protein n=1 Tax=Mesorhizobium yinganensis TaxID=3157707 RepID=UPI0032B7B7E1